MKRILLFSIALLLITLACWGWAPAARADSGYAALVVIFGPDDFHTECIALPGDMTSFDLVRESSMSVIIEPDDDGDSAMCNIDGTGCNYPDEDCYCQCGSDTCMLWTDWYWDGNQWEVSLESDERIIPNGGIEAWTWGDGLSEPPIVSLADICTGVVIEPTVEPTATTASYPAAPTQQSLVDEPYPGAAAATANPTATTSAGGATGAATATATRTAAAGRLSPTRQQGGATATLRLITPTRLSAGTPTRFAPTNQQTTAGEATPTPAAIAAAAAEGSATPDQAAVLINTSVARVRATALTTADEAAQDDGGSGGLIILGIMAIVAAGYVMLLRRQRQAAPAPTAPQQTAQAPAPAAPQEDDADADGDEPL